MPEDLFPFAFSFAFVFFTFTFFLLLLSCMLCTLKGGGVDRTRSDFLWQVVRTFRLSAEVRGRRTRDLRTDGQPLQNPLPTRSPAIALFPHHRSFASRHLLSARRLPDCIVSLCPILDLIHLHSTIDAHNHVLLPPPVLMRTTRIRYISMWSLLPPPKIVFFWGVGGGKFVNKTHRLCGMGRATVTRA